MRPTLRGFARQCQERLERGLIGSRLQAFIWRWRHLWDQDWARRYLESTEHGHRDQIVDAVVGMSPQSVLEIGCAGGANLIRIRRALPECRLSGIDLSAEAIAVARRHFEDAGDRLVTLEASNADRFLRDCRDTYDVVLTDAVLMFVAPDLIHGIIEGMMRVSRKGLVLNEYHHSMDRGSHFEGGRWVHDYARLIRAADPTVEIGMQQSTFSGGCWDRYGTLLIARKAPAPAR